MEHYAEIDVHWNARACALAPADGVSRREGARWSSARQVPDRPGQGSAGTSRAKTRTRLDGRALVGDRLIRDDGGQPCRGDC